MKVGAALLLVLVGAGGFFTFFFFALPASRLATAAVAMAPAGGAAIGAQPPLVAGGPPQPGNPLAPECPHPPLTQGFGPSTVQLEPAAHGYAHFHGGFDLACPYGTLVHNVGYSGTAHVTLSGAGYGNHVDVEIQAPQGHYWARYAHLSAVSVVNGAPVQVGELLGWEGSTGASTGPHLHFGLYLNGLIENDTVDPASWLVL